MCRSLRFLTLSVLALVIGVAGPATADSLTPVSNMTFPGPSGVPLKGYLAQPRGPGPFPAVLMIHEWWGLTPNIAAMADRLAAQGFVVLAPDAYRGRVATTPSEAVTLSSPDQFARIASDLDAAYAYLKSLPSVDSERTASLGFCFGGRQSLFLGTRQASLRATVILYGSGLLADSSQAGFLGSRGPVLGVFGADDRSIPASQRDSFRAILVKKGVRYTEAVYPGVGHAFVKDSTVDSPGPAHDAWVQVVQFLRSALN